MKTKKESATRRINVLIAANLLSATVPDGLRTIQRSCRQVRYMVILFFTAHTAEQN